MMDRVSDRYQNTLNRLQEPLEARLPADQAKAVGQFARLLYRSVSADEIEAVPVDELYGSILEGWHFLQQRRAGQSKIRVFHPDNETNGWTSSHSIILILADDMPFQIDSIRMEINRRGLALHSIQNLIIQVSRDQGRLQCLSESRPAAEQPSESFVYMEIDRYAKPSQQRGLRQALLEVLVEVRAVSGDFDAMLQRSRALLTRIKTAALPGEAAAELSAFIEWLIDNHFTFLGYELHRVVKNRSGLGLRVDPSSRLGLCRMPWGKDESRLLAELPQQPMQNLALDDLIGFAKSSHPVRVHRPVYADYVLIREFDAAGSVRCEHRILGLYTSPVYFQSTGAIPVVRTKVAAVLEQTSLRRGSHDWKELRQILETYPRDDLFQIDTNELVESAQGILHIHERRQIRLFVRRSAYGRYYSCLVYVPRDQYSTAFRQRVQALLCEAFACQQVEFNTQLSESLLARTQFILHLDASRSCPDIDLPLLQQQVKQAARSWHDDLLQALEDSYGEAQGRVLFGRFGDAFPAAYREDFSARTSIADIERMLTLNRDQPLGMSFYRPLGGAVEQLNFKLYHFGSAIPLSEVIPVMEQLGLVVLDEHPYAVKFDNQQVWLHDFGLLHSAGDQVALDQVREIFQQAFAHTWRGDSVSDSFNRLVLSAGLDWRQVAVLRAYAAYMKQTGVTLSQEAIATSLLAHTGVARLLLSIFEQRFDPDGLAPDKDAACALQQAFNQALDQVLGLTEDRVLRRFNELILATVRTNYFQREPDGSSKPALVLKLMPYLLADMPAPCPLFELFVHCARFEAVHLRTGRISRGGVLCSDRVEDYRTEALGLVNAQQVKNAVIVPMGAKGGFICRRLRDEMSASEKLDEARRCYQGLIRGMLDVTDNGPGDKLQPPLRTVRYDADDPYLMVAVDRGTTTFSDVANAISDEYQFWLGDAFASGGSQGYDHKAMGVTARGAWVSAERHFQEQGISLQQGVSVVGIGSMADDVFGNGMLLSRNIKLVAAFNERSIFVDPCPDPKSSLAERRRLFAQSDAGWERYNRALISVGGGVFSRSAKVIAMSAQMKRCLAITDDRLSANELVSALLKAPVDLLWNGALGSYVKSRSESQVQVGDKANDAVRICADELRCKVIVEGRGGLTQRGRVEFALAGGACNCDFIDGSGGINCADHEVNIKILLDAQRRAGELTLKQRNALLAAMKDQVVERVLADSLQQFEAISMAQAQSQVRAGEYHRYIDVLKTQGVLDREWASISDDDGQDLRRWQQQGLTRPELAVLISLTKGQLKLALLETDLPDEAFVQPMLQQAFPQRLVEQFSSVLSQHPLRRELIATRIANALVNHMGASFVQRMQSSASTNTADIVRAYLLASDIYDLPGLWGQIEALESQGVLREVQLRMLLEVQRLIRRAARWLLRNRHPLVLSDVERIHIQPVIDTLVERMGDWLQGSTAQAYKDRFYCYSQAGVPDQLARRVAGTRVLYAALGMTEIIDQAYGLQPVVEIYCLLGEGLELFWLSHTIDALAVANHWQASARETLRDELEQQLRRLGAGVLRGVEQPCVTEHKGSAALFDQWVKLHQGRITDWLSLLAELKNSDRQDYAVYTVAIRRLAEIAIT